MGGPFRCCANTHYVCFPCRRSIKGPSDHRVMHAPSTLRCPECGTLMKDLGQDFKPPRKGDLEQWKKIESRVRHGFTFHAGCCTEAGPRPARLREVGAFVAEKSPKSPGQALAHRFAGGKRRKR